MYRSATSPSAVQPAQSPPAPVSRIEPSGYEDTYGLPFWFNYAANMAIMVASSLLFRYADFIAFRGGTEWDLGWIVGLGMLGSLAMRFAQGVGIDQYGTRMIWLVSCCGFIGSCLAHLLITDVHGPAIYLARIVFNTSVSGIFGASITNVARRVPPRRMAEAIGTLGTSGFLGMMTGSLLGDRLFAGVQITEWHIQTMFLTAAGLGAVSMALAWASTRGQSNPPPRRQPPLGRVLQRFHPGPMLVMAAAMGFGLGIPPTFVRPFTADLGLGGIALFFWVYAPTAFITRLSIRRLPERIGSRATALWGQAAIVASMLAFLPVTANWQLVFPAVLIGIAHAMLFPAIVAGGSSEFPARFRGLGTTLMLAMFDLGNLVGSPMAGMELHLAERLGWQRYPSMFLFIAVLMAAAGLYYAWATRGQRAPDELGDESNSGESSARQRRRSRRKRKRKSGLAAT
ncbi:MAG: MFS transporter [Pirellulales bacterium]|nr:MFS transporter [Pirellulales bacterium]